MDRTNERFDDGWVPAASGALAGAADLGRALQRWASDAMVDEAARGRARERWMRIQSEEGSTLIGVLIDLAEQSRPVVLDVAGRRLTGTLVGVGADFVALRTDRGHDVLVVAAAIDSVRAHPEVASTVGDRAPTVEVCFDAVIGPLAADRPTVHVRTVGGTAVRGVLRSAGVDVLHLRADGDPPAPVWIGIAAVASLVIEP